MDLGLHTPLKEHLLMNEHSMSVHNLLSILLIRSWGGHPFFA